MVVLQFEHDVGTSPSPIALLESTLWPKAAEELLVDNEPFWPFSSGVDVPEARPDADALLPKTPDLAGEDDVPRALPVEEFRACVGTGGARILVEGPLEPEEMDDDNGPSFILCKFGDEFDLSGAGGRGFSACNICGVGALDVVVDLAGPSIAVGFPCVG